MNTASKYLMNIIDDAHKDFEKIKQIYPYWLNKLNSIAKRSRHFPVKLDFTYNVPHTSRKYSITLVIETKSDWRKKKSYSYTKEVFHYNGEKGLLVLQEPQINPMVLYTIYTPHFIKMYKGRCLKDANAGIKQVYEDLKEQRWTSGEDYANLIIKDPLKHQFDNDAKNCITTLREGIGLGYCKDDWIIHNTFLSYDMLSLKQKNGVDFQKRLLLPPEEAQEFRNTWI